MKLSLGVLLPAGIGIVSAVSDATVYMFQGDGHSNASTPTLFLPQARLIFAQRLGVSKYYGLRDASESTLSFINQFAGRREIFDEYGDTRAELILIVEGASPRTAKPLFDAWSSVKPAFTIVNVASMSINKNLVLDLSEKLGQNGQECILANAVNPFDEARWHRNSNIMHFDILKETNGIESLMAALERMRQLSDKKEMNVVVVLTPEPTRHGPTSPYAYGLYDKASLRKRFASEETINEEATFPTPFAAPSMKNSSGKLAPIRGVPALCHSSLDSCIVSTNNCSGHGACFKKHGNGDQKGACFACGCRATNETVTWAQGSKRGWKIAYWGGSACHKKDVSSAFWLIALLSIVMLGIVSWGVGMLFAIGDEKLPGVIGAGVSKSSR